MKKLLMLALACCITMVAQFSFADVVIDGNPKNISEKNTTQGEIVPVNDKLTSAKVEGESSFAFLDQISQGKKISNLPVWLKLASGFHRFWLGGIRNGWMRMLQPRSGSYAQVMQSGKNNKVVGYQSGFDNKVYVDQKAEKNLAVFYQRGGFLGGNLLAIGQLNNKNKANVKQGNIDNWSWKNQAYVLQTGDSNKTNCRQEKFNNLASVFQRGHDAYADVVQSGAGHEAVVTQHGEYDLVFVWQTGDENQAAVNQSGDWLRPLSHQKVDDSGNILGRFGVAKKASISRFGSQNDTCIIQSGFWDIASISQYGFANRARALQDGLLDESFVLQVGLENFAMILQRCSFASAQIVQAGAFYGSATIQQY